MSSTWTILDGAPDWIARRRLCSRGAITTPRGARVHLYGMEQASRCGQDALPLWRPQGSTFGYVVVGSQSVGSVHASEDGFGVGQLTVAGRLVDSGRPNPYGVDACRRRGGETPSRPSTDRPQRLKDGVLRLSRVSLPIGRRNDWPIPTACCVLGWTRRPRSTR